MKREISLAIGFMVLTTIFAEATIYVGLEQALIYNVDNSTDAGGYSFSNKESPTISSFKIGAITGHTKDSNRLEFLYNFGDKSANPTGGLKGEDVISFNLHYNITLPSITPMEELLPYVRVGLSYTISDDKYHVIGSYDETSNYAAAGLLVGIGSYYRVTDNINLLGGFDYGYRKWQDLTYGYGNDIESEDKVTKLYLGVDYIF